jgi:DNA-binding beta-propeller fold protein YncE/DNA-directed RNA polymerase subunit RPC12/RpoP
MAKTLACPSCGASVKVRRGRDSIVCKYCGSTVILPQEYQQQKVIASGKSGPGCSVAVVVVIAIMLAIGGAALVFFLTIVDKASPEGVAELVSRIGPDHDTVLESPGTVLEFGGEGIGPGRFDDPRLIAVDADGLIYVGEYSTGRFQVFDPDGEFITQWNLKSDRDVYIGGMDCTRDGRLYIAYSGNLLIHDGMTGDLLGKVDYVEDHGFEDVAIAADGSVIVTWSIFTDDILRFSSDGDLELHIPGAISSRTGDSELNMNVAVDGHGNIYVLGTFNNAVFKYASDGTFLNRFGSDGDAPGSFSAPSAIAVDATGNVLISDFGGILVFEENGLYLETIEVYGFVFGMTVDDDNLLYAISNKCMVYVYDLDEIL